MNQQVAQNTMPSRAIQPMASTANLAAFTLNEDSAMEAGKSNFITDAGAFIFHIERAQFVEASTQAQGMMLRLKTNDGTERKATVYLYYATKDGMPIFGANFINAILYLAGLPGFYWHPVQEGSETIHVAKELEGIEIGLVLEPVGKGLELRQVFEPVSRLTASEAKNGGPAEAVQKLLNRLNS